MALKAIYNGEEYDATVEFAISEAAGAVTSTDIVLHVRSDQGIPLTLGAVTLYEGETPIFFGYIEEVGSPTFSSEHNHFNYDITLVSAESIFTKRLVTGTWNQAYIHDIIQDLVIDYMLPDGFALGSISTTTKIKEEFNCKDTRLSEILDKFAEETGAVYKIEPDKKFYFVIPEDFISVTTPNDLQEISVTESAEELITVCTVSGAQEEAKEQTESTIWTAGQTEWVLPYQVSVIDGFTINGILASFGVRGVEETADITFLYEVNSRSITVNPIATVKPATGNLVAIVYSGYFNVTYTAENTALIAQIATLNDTSGRIEFVHNDETITTIEDAQAKAESLLVEKGARVQELHVKTHALAASKIFSKWTVNYPNLRISGTFAVSGRNIEWYGNDTYIVDVTLKNANYFAKYGTMLKNITQKPNFSVIPNAPPETPTALNYPDRVTGVSAVAEQNGIVLSCNFLGSDVKNITKKYVFEINKGTGFTTIVNATKHNNGYYTFLRPSEFLEADTIQAWQVRCKAVNLYDLESQSYSETVSVNVDAYGTWLTGTPIVSGLAIKRQMTLQIFPATSSRERYGEILYRVEIKRDDDAQYYKPNLIANPYSSETAYRDGEGYVSVTNTFLQIVPMKTQSDDPTATGYVYKVTPYNVTTGQTGTAVEVGLIATASTAEDVVRHSLDATKFNVQNLAAIASVFGSIASDAIEITATQFWNLARIASNLGYNVQGEFCLGTNASVLPYDAVMNPQGYKDEDSFFHFIPQNTVDSAGRNIIKGLYMKLQNFIVTAIESKIVGDFAVESKATGRTLFEVSEQTDKISGLQQTQSTEAYENVTRVTGLQEMDALDVTELSGKVYSVTGDNGKLLEYNPTNNTEIARDVPTGDQFTVCETVGSDIVCVDRDKVKAWNGTAWRNWLPDLYGLTSVTISSANKNRRTSQIYNGKLYCPSYDGTTMDIIDLSDNSYVSVTISSTSIYRFTSQIYNGKLYCPSDNGTTMDIIDLSDNSYVSVIISSVGKQRRTSQIYNGKLYCPSDGTTMDIIDLSDNSYTSVTISSTGKYRLTSQIYNGKLYCPSSNGTTMDIIDLSNNSYISVTISTTNKNRFTSQIYNGKLYCPSYDGTTMDIIDLSDNSYVSVTISSTSIYRFTSQIYNGKLYCPSDNGTTMDIIDLSDNSYTSVTISSTSKQRNTSQIYNGKLYCPIYDGTTMDIIQLASVKNTYKPISVYANNNIYLPQANLVERTNGVEVIQIPLTSMPTPMHCVASGTDVYITDLVSGRIAKIASDDTVTYTATTAKTGYSKVYCSGTTCYFTGTGAKILRVTLTTGAQTEISLTTLLDNTKTYVPFFLSNYIYIFPQTASSNFARIPTASFALGSAEKFTLYNNIGNLRSKFYSTSSIIYLAEKVSGVMNKFTGVLFDLITVPVLKEIGSGFVSRKVNFDSTIELTAADGEKLTFDASKNLIAPKATLADTATLLASRGGTEGTPLRIAFPGGAANATTSATKTGAIKITLPQSWTSTMMRMTIKIFEYSTGKSFELVVAGYNYIDTGSWFNPTAYIVGQTARPLKVRFGHDGTKCCIYIGELASSWLIPKVYLTDFEAGQSNTEIAKWQSGWAVTFETSFGTISHTVDASLHATTATTTDKVPFGAKTGTSVGEVGQISADASYIYICTSTNVWKRVALSSF